MSKKQILIYDDDPNTVERWKRMIEDVVSNFDVVPVGKEHFEEAAIQLEQRRRAARTESTSEIPWGKHLFDTAAILIIDYDLINPNEPLDPNTQIYPTGEDVAYLARCYSRCGLVIALNQYGVNSFDLTLNGHPESFADLNIGEQQFDNPGLWKEPWAGFRAWSWPLLPRAVEAFEKRVRQLKKHLKDPILSFLGFPNEIASILPRSTAEFIEVTSKKPEETTFIDFVTKSENGLRRRDKPADDESIARIAAARISKWLERLVLPGQDILVDAPHLVSRYPSLLRNSRKNLESWNKTASLGKVNRLGIDHRKIEAFRFTKDGWLSRVAWFWPQVSNFNEIKEVADPWSATDLPEWVFCEDLSRFLPRIATREFVADLPSPFVRRFVVGTGTKEGRRFAKAVKGVDYRPSVRFSL